MLEDYVLEIIIIRLLFIKILSFLSYLKVKYNFKFQVLKIYCISRNTL